MRFTDHRRTFFKGEPFGYEADDPFSPLVVTPRFVSAPKELVFTDVPGRRRRRELVRARRAKFRFPKFEKTWAVTDGV